MTIICRFGAVKSVNLVKQLSGSDNTAEGNVLQLDDKSIKIEPNKLREHDNSTEAASECSVPNESIDIPCYSDPAGKDVDPTPEGLGQKDHPSNATLCEGHAPGADLDGIQERVALPTLQQVEANDKAPEAFTDEDKHLEAAEATAQLDDDAVEKGLVDSTGSETCRSATLGDEAEKSEQLGADGASEDHKVKAPTVTTGVSIDAFVFEPGSILVEFTREEAACMAAHSLHGRCFGNRAVSVRYAPYDLYLQKYPR
jgi:splicing factor U2AF 65 kDa subunit